MARTARRWWYVIALGALVAALAAAAVLADSEARYEAETRLLVGPLSGQLDTVRASGLLAQTYAELAVTDEVLDSAADRAGVDESPSTLRNDVEARADETTRVLTITVTDESPRAASALAQGIADELVATATDDERALPPLESIDPTTALTAQQERVAGSIRVIEPASAPDAPLGQPVALLVALAGIAGALVAFAGALVLDHLPWTRPARADLSQLKTRRLLGVVRVAARRARHARLVVARRPERASAAAYKRVATKIQLLAAPARLRSLAVIGARGDEGSGQVAGNLAFAFAQSGRVIALLDLAGDRHLQTEMRRSGQPRIEKVSGNVLEYAQTRAGRGEVLFLESADPALRDDGEHGPSQLVDELLHVADLVVVHAPPLLVEFGSVLVAQQVHAVAMVASDRERDYAPVIEALDTLESVDARVVGTIVSTRRRFSRDEHRRLQSAGRPTPARRTEDVPESRP